MCSWCRCAEDYEKAMTVIDAARAWAEWMGDDAKHPQTLALIDAVRALDGGDQ